VGGLGVHTILPIKLPRTVRRTTLWGPGISRACMNNFIVGLLLSVGIRLESTVTAFGCYQNQPLSLSVAIGTNRYRFQPLSLSTAVVFNRCRSQPLSFSTILPLNCGRFRLLSPLTVVIFDHCCFQPLSLLTVVTSGHLTPSTPHTQCHLRERK
jgi:hypothetical protein